MIYYYMYKVYMHPLSEAATSMVIPQFSTRGLTDRKLQEEVFEIEKQMGK